MSIAALLLAPMVAAAQTPALPRLIPRFTTHLIDASPRDRLTPIRVGPQGNVLFVTNTDPKALLLLVDSTGKELTRFGRTGGGPGEVTVPSPLAVTRDGMMVWDGGSHRASEWDLGGRFRHEELLQDQGTIAELVGNEYFTSKYTAGTFKPVMVTRATGAVRELVPPNDTFFKAHFDTAGKGRPKFAPIPGLWDGGFLVADAAAYRIALYTWNGVLVRVLARDLPPVHMSLERIDDFLAEMARRSGRSTASLPPAMLAQQREQGQKEALPQITPGALPRTDAQHRLWVVGMEGDSAFADLFTAQRFIGRLHLPCRFFNGFWSVSGTWLALACVPDDPNATVDAVVKLFKIVEAK